MFAMMVQFQCRMVAVTDDAQAVARAPPCQAATGGTSAVAGAVLLRKDRRRRAGRKKKRAGKKRKQKGRPGKRQKRKRKKRDQSRKSRTKSRRPGRKQK